MISQLIAIVLTVLAAVAVVLTRLRLGADGGAAAGRLSIPKAVLNTHTVAGGLALVLWTVFLVTGRTLFGFLALVPWWVTVVAGLLILARWTPAKGRHSSDAVSDNWGQGPGLSVLAHVGMLIGVVTFSTLLLLGAL